MLVMLEIKAALMVAPVQTYTVRLAGSTNGTYANGDRRLTIRVPAADMPTAPASGSTLRVVKE